MVLSAQNVVFSGSLILSFVYQSLACSLNCFRKQHNMVNDRMFFRIFKIFKNISLYYICYSVLFVIFFRWNSLCVNTCTSIQELTSVFQASYLVIFIIIIFWFLDLKKKKSFKTQLQRAGILQKLYYTFLYNFFLIFFLFPDITDSFPSFFLKR